MSLISLVPRPVKTAWAKKPEVSKISIKNLNFHIFSTCSLCLLSRAPCWWWCCCLWTWAVGEGALWQADSQTQKGDWSHAAYLVRIVLYIIKFKPYYTSGSERFCCLHVEPCPPPCPLHIHLHLRPPDHTSCPPSCVVFSL